MKSLFKNSAMVVFCFWLASCGHSQSNLPGTQDAPPSLSNGGRTPAPLPSNTPQPGGNLKTVIALNEGDSLTQRPDATSYRSLLTQQWQDTFIRETGLSRAETQELYRSSVFDRILGLEGSEILDWYDSLPIISVDRWFKTSCRSCRKIKNRSLGTAKQFLTGERSLPALAGAGASPAVAFDPVGRNYIIVWDEKGENDESGIYARLISEDGNTIRIEHKQISVDRPTHGCLYAGFREDFANFTPPDPEKCKKNGDPAVAYNNGNFLITWTKMGEAPTPAGEKFSVILGKLVRTSDLEPTGNDWNEGILLSKFAFASSDPNQAARNDSEIQSWARNRHSTVAPYVIGNNNAGSFLLVWDTTNDFTRCHAPTRRTSTSIYGRMISPNFNPRGGNRNFFPIYTDPTTTQRPCPPNSEVNRAQKPRVALFNPNLNPADPTRQFLAVFEVSKNNSGTNIPSIGSTLLTVSEDLNASVASIYFFDAMVDTQMHQGCFNPDVVAGPDRFLVVDDIAQERVKLTEVRVNGGTVETGSSQIYSGPDGKQILNPRVVINRIVGQENEGRGRPLEYVVAYEARPASGGSAQSQIQLASFNQGLTPMDDKVTLQADGYPTNMSPALASGGGKVLTAWNAQNGDDSRIFSSVAVVDSNGVQNLRPVAAIDVQDHLEDPVVLISGQAIAVSGASSYDPEGTRLTGYVWSQPVGEPQGRFEPNSGAQTTFTAPTVSSSTAITLQLIVTAEDGLSSLLRDSGQKRVMVNPDPSHNNPPRARITRMGDVGGSPIMELTVDESVRDPVIVGGSPSWPRTRISLSGITSDDGETPSRNMVLRYHWEQTDVDTMMGNGIDMATDPDQRDFSFLVPNVSPAQRSVVLTIRLTVDDNGDGVHQASQDVRITVNYINHTPTPPVSIAPENDITMPPTHVALTWQPSVDFDVFDEADYIVYDVFFGTENPPRFTLATCRGIPQTRCVVDTLEADTTYYWRAAVRDFSNQLILGDVRTLRTDHSVLARWTFDDGPEGLCDGDDPSLRGHVVCDVSGHNRHGRYADRVGGTIVPDWLSNGDRFLGDLMNGISGTALGFRENMSVVFSNFALGNIPEVSTELWVYPIGLTGGMKHTLFQSWSFDTGDSNHIVRVNVELDGDSRNILFTVNNSSNDRNDNHISISTVPLSLHQWSHIVCTSGPSGMKIYINGVLSSPASPGALPIGPSSVGESYFGWDRGRTPVNYFLGVMDEGGIYNRELTPGVVENLSQIH